MATEEVVLEKLIPVREAIQLEVRLMREGAQLSAHLRQRDVF